MIVKFETAKLAKEKGFNEECTYLYTESGKRFGIQYYDPVVINDQTIEDYFSLVPSDEVPLCSAPTQSELQRWLREVHNIHLAINVGIPHREKDISYYGNVIKLGRHHKNKYRSAFFKTFEEALEDVLKKALEEINSAE